MWCSAPAPPLRPVRYRQAQDDRPSDRIGPVPLTSIKQRYEPQLTRLSGSDTANAAGLAGAMAINQVIGRGATIVFSREPTDDGLRPAVVRCVLGLGVDGSAM